jgi:hypothetical protein
MRLTIRPGNVRQARPAPFAFGGSLACTFVCAVASCHGTDKCLIETSNYDQTCSVDADCITMVGIFPIQSGNFCQPQCLCGGGTINKQAAAQYVRDVSSTPLGSGSISQELCNCLPVEPTCCAGGRCTIGLQCIQALLRAADAQTPEDASEDALNTSDAESTPTHDSGGAPPGATVMCGLNSGPFDAGVDAGGPWRWCQEGESCVPFNGGWACCMIQPAGGLAICVAPLPSSTGL